MYLSECAIVSEIEEVVNDDCRIDVGSKERPNNTDIFRNEGIRSVAWLNSHQLSDPRIEHRIKCVVGYLFGKFKGASSKVVREISSKELRSELVFGEGKSTRELQDCLLLRVGKYVKGKKNNRYKLELSEFNPFIRKLNWSAEECLEYYLKARIEYFESKYSSELQSGEFAYSKPKQKMSSREFHEIVSESKFVRNKLLAKHGYKFQFDIKSCFPTLALQAMKVIRPNVQLMYLEYLVSQPDELRLAIAEKLDVSVGQVKVILSSLLFGAKLNATRNVDVLSKYTIFEALDYDLAKWEELRSMPFIVGFMKNIVSLKLYLPQCAVPSNFKQTSPFADAAGFTKLYWTCELLEKVVREMLVECVHQAGGRCLKIHDCVATDVDVSVEELVQWVAAKSNGEFSIKLSRTEY
ncbi:hypothetical protein HZU83_12890 [Sphaerotilus montanus]|uniref:Uncharacterized protein n=1 Tax=Sphaerotilus montanus TaxID=522889 RepID=A0A7Y9QVD2_9BURK|nr:hypothetical protein [Sphaerotilus montanus]NYG32110.1 hypothetical protein [Sphaerotilus montanus]NZD57586.1 hypothetical protein [Sphaerotilus montanus]